jgi:SAM-dependent methyltransferase
VIPTVEKLPEVFWQNISCSVGRRIGEECVYHEMLVFPNDYVRSLVPVASKEAIFTPLSLSNYDHALPFIIWLADTFRLDKEQLRILDVGCFSGLSLKFLQKKGFPESFGIDIDPKCQELWKSLDLRKVRLIGFEEMGSVFEKGSFDVIMCIGVIHEEIDKKESLVATALKLHKSLIDGASRLLGKGGILIVRSPAPGIGESVAERIRRAGFEILFSDVEQTEIFAQKRD